ncbi:cytochrome P450 [Bradyrhizobium sp. NP1]|uniref:cytochrome P450 n=1 Tax=Bradyrhizobium sp. NP1 TaxID=3049772 RepID=UPI0025A4D8C4|nr:cytochrome P450 [Bradyrhizobium sp. NP1]WJR80550.1 cytochrome P450 [Bradyrhizobium sp. NP1]
MGIDATAIRPVSTVDPFSHAFLTDPYPHHQAMREAGPAVWLAQYGIWAMARHQEVRDALTDWQTYCSGAGVGLSDFRKEPPWRPPSIILEADPPLHTRTRAVLTRILSPAAINVLRETFTREAEALAGRLVARGSFDGVADLAEAYPLKVFPDAVGISEEGRENLLPYGNMVFNSFGPRNDLFEKAMANAAAVRDWIMSKCSRAALAPEGLGMQIFAAVDAGELSEVEAGMLVRSFLSAGIDTTVYGLGNALYCFAQYPEQWTILRENPNLMRLAFEEVLRFEAPVQTFFRTTTRAVDVGGVKLADGEKVLLFLAAANRDPRRWERPDSFDIRRRATGHMTFGTGIHGCVGQAIARLETEAVFSALVKRVKAFELVDEPVRRLNNTLRGFDSLPLRVVPA